MTPTGWQRTFQREVKNLGLSGLTVASMRGKVQLKLRSKEAPDQSVCLPFDWEEKNCGDPFIIWLKTNVSMLIINQLRIRFYYWRT